MTDKEFIEKEQTELVKRFIRIMEPKEIMESIDNTIISSRLTSNEVFRLIHIERRDLLENKSYYMSLMGYLLSSYKFSANARESQDSLSSPEVFRESIKLIPVELRKDFWYSMKHRFNKKSWNNDIGELRRYLAIRDLMPEVMTSDEKILSYLNPDYIKPYQLSIILEEDMKKYFELINLVFKHYKIYNNRRSFNDSKIISILDGLDNSTRSRLEKEFTRAYILGFIEKETLEKWKKCLVEINL